MNQVLKIESKELSRLSESKAAQIKSTFEPMVTMLEGFESSYNEVIELSKDGITQEITAKAKRLRLDISKVRVQTSKLKDKQKEYIKLEDKAIMGVHNIVVYAIKEKEDKLREIENYFAILEKERLNQLQLDRVELLSKYIDDAEHRDLAKFEEDEFNALLQMKKKEFEDNEKAKKEAEEVRILKEKQEAEERDRINKENQRLKKEAEEREKQAKIEREKQAKIEAERIAKQEAERKIREEKERKEKAAYEAKLKAEREAREKLEREERLKREKLQAELKAKQEAERKYLEKKEAELQAELNKGDSDKVKDLINDLESLKTKYEFKSDKNKEKYDGVKTLIDKVIGFINQ